jgi:two-component system cell cycle response regulator
MSETLLDRLRKVGKLPTPPGVIVKLLELTRQEDVSMRDIADAIGMDAALSARILKFANSPMAGLPRQVTSLQQAVSLIGLRGVEMMALSFSLLGSKTSNTCPGFDQETFWTQSLACGVAARTIASNVAKTPPEEAFVAGLLSQIGRSVFATGVPEVYAKVLAASKQSPRDLPPLERAVLGETYATIGSKLLRDWGLPEELVEAIAVFRSLGEMEDGIPRLALILSVAETAANIMCPDPRSDLPRAETFFPVMKEHFGTGQEDAIAVFNGIAESVEETRSLLEMPKGNLRSPEDIEAELRDRVAELSLATQVEAQRVEQQNKELLRRATTDRLTGLSNRAAFDERIAVESERACRSATPMALMMLDVDKFKLLNDAHGHQAGDKVLQGVARALERTARKVDFVARYGGEEFAVIAVDARPENALHLADRLRESVAENEIEWEGQTLQVTISIGVATLTKVPRGLNPAVLIKLADAQLYNAKITGRNRVEACIDGKPLVAATTA